MNSKIIIIYYSWSGNTGKIARTIQAKTSGQLYEIKPLKEYSQDYKSCLDMAKREINSGFTPELKAKPENIDSYDIIFIGSPIWWGTMAPPVLTLLKQVDLSGKKVVPFCTHGGGGQGRFTHDVNEICRKSLVMPELVLFGNGGPAAESSISGWLDNLTLLSGV